MYSEFSFQRLLPSVLLRQPGAGFLGSMPDRISDLDLSNYYKMSNEHVSSIEALCC
jgi:hypothetical protein